MKMIDSTLNPEQNLERQSLRIYQIYTVFRLILAAILLISFILGSNNTVLGMHNPGLFYQTNVYYIGINLVILFATFFRTRPLDHRLTVATIIIDIIVLAIISNTCGGVSSGMTHLLILPIAAGAVLITGILSIFLAAIGAIAVLYSEVYLMLLEISNSTDTVQAGILGFILFFTAVIIQFLSKHIRNNEKLAMEQEHRIQALTAMNKQIIQRMNTGLIVVNKNERVIMSNDAGLKLLQIAMKEGTDITDNPDITLPVEISETLSEWLEADDDNKAPYRLDLESQQLQIGFSYLDTDTRNEILIYIEDYARLLGRAQRIKLVSLGRLTASIAHEVRNPLGAISHASQLLNESKTLYEDDARLIEIIHNHSKRVNRIIQDILEVSRAQKSMVPEVIKVDEWLPHFIDSFRSSQNDPVVIELEIRRPELKVRFSLSQLDQLMTNLCENGVRYSLINRKNNLTIIADVNETTERPYFDIIDEGPGIDEENIPHIFEPFFTTEKTGTGLGLYISREICETHQADLSYFKTEDGRSCFRLTFSHPNRHLVEFTNTEKA